MSPYHHILFATDLSEVNYLMRQRVLDLASTFRARLSVVHIVTSSSAFSRSYSLTLGLQEALEAQAKDGLRRFCEPLQVPQTDQIIKVGQPADEITATAKKTNADLLIVGRYGESGVMHLLGSVTHRLLNKAPCEMLLIDKPHQ